MSGDQTDAQTISIDDIKRLIESVLFPIPRPWLLLMAGTAFLSLFSFSQSPDGNLLFQFKISSITVSLLALIWLPFLLKAVALTGGGLKAMGAETKVGGLLDLVSRLGPSDRRDALPMLIATAETAEANAPSDERSRLKRVRDALEMELITLAPEAQQARQRLQELARTYEDARKAMSPGAERTLKLTSIVTEARSLAAQANYNSLEISDLFAGRSEGNRIVSLALVQAKPDARFFDLVLESIAKSRSAFEQFHALSAAERMLPMLDKAQKEKLAAAIRDQRSGGPKKYITPSSDRWALSDRIIRAIG